MKMRLSLFFILVFLLNFNSKVLAQNTKLTFDLEKVTLEEVFDEIRKNSEFKVLYMNSEIDVNRITSIKVSGENIETVLKILFTNTPVEYNIVGKQIILNIKKSEKIPSQEIPVNSDGETKLDQKVTVEGVVNDKDGTPLPEVNIIVVGSDSGVSTDFDGKFTLDVTKGSILEFSSIGMETYRVIVEGETFLQIKLEEDISSLNEVIITALGIERGKNSIAYSITELEGDEFTEARETNVANSLQGKVAGVNVTNIASGPAGSSRVVIRGASSLQGHNQPLYVVDGIPIDNQNLGSAGMWGGRDQGDGIGSINPDDIETMTVLKGNTAGALYGFRASNGVILITTKSGQNNQGSLNLEINSNFVVEQPINRLDTQTQYGHGDNGVKPTTFDEAYAFGDRAWGGKLDGSMVYQFDGIQRPYSYTGDNFGKFYETGTTFTNTISLSGGNEKIGYRFSASDLSNNGVIPNNSMDRNNFSINAHGKVGEKLSFQTSGSYILQETRNPPAQGDLVSNVNFTVWSLAPSLDVKDLIGNNPDVWGARADGTEMTPGKTIWFENPYFSAYEKENTSDRSRFIGSMSLRYDFNEWIYLKGRIGIDQWNRSFVNIRPYGGAQSPDGFIQQGQSKFKETNADIMLGSDYAWANGFGYNVILGGSQMRQNFYRNNTDGGDFAIPGWANYNNTLIKGGSVASYELGVNSIYGLGELSYKSYLFLTLTGRRDWYSTLNGRGTFYPSVSLSGVLSKIISLPASIDYLKIRAAWAEVGGGEPSAYFLNQTYGLEQPHNGIPQGGIIQDFVVNSDLKPYTVGELEVGLEAYFLNNRLGVDFAYYNRKTENDILQSTISQGSGYEKATVNVGELTNKGIELLLTGTPVQTKGFSWDVSLNMSYNKSKVISLIDENIDNEMIIIEQNRAQTAYVSNIEGLPYGQVVGWQYLRDVSGNVIISNLGLPQRDEEAGLVSFGAGVHPFYGGLQSTFNYKQFSLSFLIDYKGGAVLFSGTNSWLYRRGMHKNTLVGREHGIGNIPASKISSYYNEIRNKIAEEFIYNADFSKLRELIFSYTLPNGTLSNLGISSAKVSFVGRNLFLLYSDVENIDPESAYNEGNGQGMDYFQVPQTRSYGFNVNLKF